MTPSDSKGDTLVIPSGVRRPFFVEPGWNDVERPFVIKFSARSIRNDTQNRSWGYPHGGSKHQIGKGLSQVGNQNAPLYIF